MNVVELDNLDDPRLEPYFNLTNHELARHEDGGVFIAESYKVIDVALREGLEPVSFVMEPKRLERYSKLVEKYCPDADVFVLPHELLSTLVGFNVTRGVFCCMKRPANQTFEEVVASAKKIALVEGVTDTTNVGALFRSAAALGADAVVLDPTCADPLSRRAVRVSMGSVFLVPWTRAEAWPTGAFETLKRNGFTVAACALSHDTYDLDDPRLKEFDKLALLFGTEGDGLKKETLDAADFAVKIPMAHQVDSLNVAAASAVFFWQLFASK
jgi:tRNA G18 (ribose-2'-O)-methylase SpoU